MKNVIVCLFCSLVLLASVMILVMSREENKSVADVVVESGQDQHGNCYLYIKKWKWVELIDCSRIDR